MRWVVGEKDECTYNGCSVTKLTMNQLLSVCSATTILKDLIGQRTSKEVIEPTFYGIKRFELSYYRNQVIHLFVEECKHHLTTHVCLPFQN